MSCLYMNSKEMGIFLNKKNNLIHDIFNIHKDTKKHTKRVNEKKSTKTSDRMSLAALYAMHFKRKKYIISR